MSPSRGLSSFRTQDKAGLLSPVDPGISRGVTDLYPSLWDTPRNTRDRSITRSLQSRVLIKNTFLFDLTAEVYFSVFITPLISVYFRTTVMHVRACWSGCASERLRSRFSGEVLRAPRVRRAQNILRKSAAPLPWEASP